MSDWIRKSITKYLKAPLEIEGFYRSQPKHFVRVRGNLVDNISFDLSQYGSKSFYVHYFTNLACSANTKSITSSYYIGNRIHRCKDDDTKWIGDTEETANLALNSVLQAIEIEVLPWFESYSTIESYTLELAGQYTSTYESLDLLMALILCGKFGKPYDMIKQMSEAGGNDKHQATIDFLWDSIKAPQELGVPSKYARALAAIEEIRKNNLSELKLNRFLIT